MASTRKPKTRRRHSIAEWHGVGFETMTPSQRFERAQLEIELDALTGAVCPFQERATCNKKGGVCSLRAYEQTGDGPVVGTGPVVTTCPLRFLENNTIFRWVGETILETSKPLVLNEIGFLDRLRPDLHSQGD